jgi:hypothetical protein
VQVPRIREAINKLKNRHDSTKSSGIHGSFSLERPFRRLLLNLSEIQNFGFPRSTGTVVAFPSVNAVALSPVGLFLKLCQNPLVDQVASHCCGGEKCQPGSNLSSCQ